MAVTITPIRRPGVDVIQQVTTTSPTVAAPALVPCLVGPCIQIVDAIDANSNLVAEALSGSTFSDNLGDLTYALPGIEQGALLDVPTIQPYLVYGQTRQALNPATSQSIVYYRSGTGGITQTQTTWVDAGADFVTAGVAAGDQIEFVANNVTHRLLVASVGNLTTLNVHYAWTLSTVATTTYTIYRNGVDFEVDTNPAQAALTRGTAAAYNDLTYTAVLGGLDGNSISVEVADPGAINQVLTVVRTGTVLEVLLATDNDGVVTSTAEDVLVALNGASKFDTAEAPFNAAADEAITFRSALNGATAGQAIRVSIAAPAGGVIAIVVAGSDITITPAVAPASTAIDVCAAVNADPGASALVQAYPTGAGTTNVTNQGALTNLTVGNDAAQGAAGFLINVTTAAAMGAEIGGPAWAASGAPFQHAPTLLAGGTARANTVTIYEDRIGLPAVTALVYFSYEALRLDVSDQASVATTGNDPDLVIVESTTDITTLLGDGSTPRNPLAFAATLALANAPTSQVSCLGVSAISVSEPEGTAAAYTTAFEFLESREIYSIVPLTQAPAVHSLLRAHVVAMSDPDERGERIGLVNQANPTFTANETITSETGYTTTGTPLATFAASVDFVAEGVVITTDYLQIANQTGPDTLPNDAGTGWQITAVLPASVTVDGTVIALPASSLTAAWSIIRIGTAITTAAGRAQAIAEIGHGFLSSRMVHVVPQTCEVLVSGVATQVPGYYVCAGIAGMIAELNPSQGFTNYPMAGYVGVRGSHDSFTTTQLNLIAGGGNYIIIQDSATGPLYSRMQLTTDYRTVESRELNIRKQLDFTAKFYRSGLQAYIGVFNITNVFMDMLATVIEGLSIYLGRKQILRTAPRLVSIVQDTVSPDTLLVTLEVEILYPNNYVQITLLV